MKYFLKQMLLMSALVPCSVLTMNLTLNVAPYLQFRSPDRDTIIKIIGMDHHTHLYDMETYYGTMFIRADYAQSFRPGRLAEMLFGPALIQTPSGTTNSDNNDGRMFLISGTELATVDASGNQNVNATRNPQALMAENFYLPRDFASTVTVKPQARTFRLDFHFYMALDEWVQGLYFRIFGPFVHERYNLHMSETVTNTGTLGYEEGFLDSAFVPTTSLLTGFMGYLAGQAPTGLVTTTASALAFARVNTGTNNSNNTTGPTSASITQNSFAGLRLELTYDFLLDEDYHLGIGIQGLAPTGKRPNADFLFPPNAGNGKLWELGGVVTGHYTFWRSEDEDKHFDFVLEADITHMFKAKQRLTLDLIGKPLSRYMLATKNGTPVELLNSSPTNSGSVANVLTPLKTQYQDIVAPLANISTRDVKVSVGAQGDLSAMFNFTCKGFSWNIGYNFWGRSTEDVDLRNEDSMAFPENTWALKGDAMIFGFAGVGITGLAVGAALELSATENSATIFAGTNATSKVTDGTTTLSPLLRNYGVDSALFAYATNPSDGTTTRLIYFSDSTGAGNSPNNTIKTSNPSIFIKATDLNLEGAQTRGISNTVFTNFNYTFISCENWIPYIDVGATAEFGGHVNTNNNNANPPVVTTSTVTTSNNTIDSALTQWSVWFRVGLSFN